MTLKSIMRALVAGLGLSSVLGGCNSDGSVAGVEVKTWDVDGRLAGKEDKDGGYKKAKDLSGIACDRATGFPRRCLAVNDEGLFAQAVTLEDGRLVARAIIPLVRDTFDGKTIELDGEGLAFANGAFYVMGSHGHPRDKNGELDPQEDADEIAAKIKANSQVLRLMPPDAAWQGEGESAADVTSSARLREALRSVGELQPFVDRRLDDNGLTAEGLAIAGGKLLAGLRAPLLAKQAAVVTVNLDAMFGDSALEPRLTKLDLGGRGIRDLAEFDGGFLVLAGPSAGEEGDYAIYRWDGAGAATLLAELIEFRGEDEKPEAILPLDDTGGALRVLLLLDGVKYDDQRGVDIVTIRR